MSMPIVTAVTDTSWETELLTAVEAVGHDVTVVRRCVDLADLLATAATGMARAAVVSANLRRLDADAISRMRAAGLQIIALAEPGNDIAERRIRQLGVVHVFPADAPPAAVVEVLLGLAAQPTSGAAPPYPSTNGNSPWAAAPVSGSAVAPASPAVSSSAPPATTSAQLPVTTSSAESGGKIIAVWGATGAPGRTTVAIGLADESARAGIPTLLIDADTYGGVISQGLGMLDEAPGIAAAARAHHHGALDVQTLASYSRQADRNLTVLTGIARADRWPELRADAVAGVLACARRLAAVTVVDCGFCLEDDEELSYDTIAPRRNAATLAVLRGADRIVAVGSADPTGVARLVRGLGELAEAVPTAAGRAPVVVMNRLRKSAMSSGDPAKEVSEAMRRFAGIRTPFFLPYDREAADRAVAVGRTLGDAAPRSALRVAFTQLASGLLGLPGQSAPPQVSSARGRR